MKGKEAENGQVVRVETEELQKPVPAETPDTVSSFFIYYLGLGTNLGDKDENLHTAIRLLGKRVGQVSARSGFYATEPWGFASENTFLNAVVCLHSPLPPMDVLRQTQAIECDMGRSHKSVNGVYTDRLIDIDLLVCLTSDGELIRVHTPQLTLPHPLIKERDFVMKPLAEVMPFWNKLLTE